MVSGYDELEKNATGYDIPIFFSETGCNDPEPRTFDDQSAIFGPQMSDTWSGAIIYEWIQEANNYGLISYGPEAAATDTASNVVGGFTRSGTPTPISPDFDNLSKQWATLSPSGVAEAAYKATSNPPACPSYTSGLWEVSGNVPLPTIGATGTRYTTATGTSTGASSSTSSSSASATTRSASFALRKRDQLSFWSKLRNFSQEHRFAWWVISSVMGFVGLAAVV